MLEKYCISLLGEVTALYGVLTWFLGRKIGFRFLLLSSFLILCAHMQAYYYLNAYTQIQISSVLLAPYFGSEQVYYWDSLSSAMLFLNISISFLVLLYTSHLKKKDLDIFGYFWMAIGILNILFLTQHALLFFISFECVLIPFGFWLLHDRSTEGFIALRQFVLYTACGSIFLLFGLIYAFVENGQSSWLFSHLSHGPYHATDWSILTFSFLIPFLIKLPIWPLHGWLPLAHTQAPTQASVILAASVLKIGGYGLLRLLPLIGDKLHDFWSNSLILIGVLSLMITSMSAYSQKTFKKIIAYSSIVHMAWVTMGIGLLLSPSVNSQWVVQAIVIQMLAHGFVSAGLFCIVGLLYDRTHFKMLEDYRGISYSLPLFSKYLAFFTLANASLPMTAGFIGEFMILLALYRYNSYLALIALTSFLLNAAYNIRYWNTIIEDRREPNTRFSGISDCSPLEHFIFISLSCVIVSLGIVPGAYLHFFGFGAAGG